MKETNAMLAQIGMRIRSERKNLQIATSDVVQAASLSRATLHRLENGAENAAIGLYVKTLAALGLELVVQPKSQNRESLPEKNDETDADRLRVVNFKDCPELRKIAWHAPGIDELPAPDALHLYERNWRHVDQDALGEQEKQIIRRLTEEYGHGVFLV